MKELVNKELTPAINNILFIYIYVHFYVLYIFHASTYQ
jgi:hypothetical protein